MHRPKGTTIVPLDGQKGTTCVLYSTVPHHEIMYLRRFSISLCPLAGIDSFKTTMYTCKRIRFHDVDTVDDQSPHVVQPTNWCGPAWYQDVLRDIYLSESERTGLFI